MTVPPDDTTTNPQSVIAALQQRLDAALSEKAALADALATRNSEFGEQIAHQAATIDVLKAMSASPGDPQPLFDLIARLATEVCNVPTTGLFEYDGELVHLRTSYRGETILASGSLRRYAQRFPMRPIRGSITCRAILDRQIVHIHDLAADRELADLVRELGHRSQVSVPLMRDGLAIGAITVAAMEPGGFADSQIALLQTFAEQAVIAITSAETYRALEERTATLARRNVEYHEKIEHQAATIDVLKIMSASPGDPQPVFDLIVRQAREQCNSANAIVFEYDGMIHCRSIVSNVLPRDTLDAYLRRFPMPLEQEPTNAATISMRNRRTVHIRDASAEEGFSAMARSLGVRSGIAVPLIKAGDAVGCIALTEMRPGGYSDSQIELLKTFAEQAVIAITSAETYRALQTRTSDLQQSLEYQTATSDVLKVISRSAFDLQPVLETVVQTSARLCNADRAAIFRREGDLWRLAVNFGFPPAWQDYIKAQSPFSLDRFAEHAAVRAVVERRPVHIDDLASVPGYENRLGEQRTTLGVPLLRGGEAIGTIVLARLRVEPFTDRQVELVNTFADQAVIALENTRLITEQREALEQQTATAEVLQVINASPGNLAPVFDAMLERARRLCEAAIGFLWTWDGEAVHRLAFQGIPIELMESLRQPFKPKPGSIPDRIIAGESVVSEADLLEMADARRRWPVLTRLRARSVVGVALRKDDILLGGITIYRQEVRPFTNEQIALLQNFAAQAVIAMENARLLTEQREALERQTATAEVLRTINENPANLEPVFDVILEKALSLAEAAFGTLWIYRGDTMHAAALRGMTPALAEFRARNPVLAVPPVAREASETRRAVQMLDIRESESYRAGRRASRAIADLGGARTNLVVPLLKDNESVGCIQIYRQEVRVFTPQQISLLEGFAAQAVIAMDNARLLNEIRQRQNELDITFENMGDGVAMFDRDHRLAAWNRNFQDILNLPDEAVRVGLPFADYIRGLAARGEYGPDAKADEQIVRLTMAVGQANRFERTRPNGRVIDVRHNPIQGGGFVVIYADITERKCAEEALRVARDEAETALRELKVAQANLIQAEKMASLGQLTAGIAHEIKNPLNFVNNFASLSVDLLDELKQTASPAFAMLDADRRAEIDDLTRTLSGNLEKINEHGNRADGIVRSMLEHSRGSYGERRSVNLNILVDEALNLAYHGARARDQSFNVVLQRIFGEAIAPVTLVPQDVTRVLLNLFSNGFYAAQRRQSIMQTSGFEPTLSVATRELGDAVEIRVRDNGIGIPPDIRDKVFQPFFTTKLTGEGTGLGLSISYDIITQQHGGSITLVARLANTASSQYGSRASHRRL